MTDRREVLSALIDREPVDPEVLARVLEEPDGRAMLVDFVRVRASVNADEEGESARPPAMRDRLAGGGPKDPALGSGRTTFGGSRASGWLRAAAVFLLIAGGAGGGAWAERYLTRERPPEPDRVVRLDPVPAPGASEIARNEPGRKP